MGILFLPARQGRCSGLLFCSAVRPLLLLRPRPRLTPTSAMDTLASEAMEDTEDMVLATAALDTPDLVTLVATDSVTEVTPGDTTESVRLRLSPRLMLMPRLTPTTAMDTLASEAMALVATPMEDTDTAVDADTAADTPALDIPDSDTAVATSEDMATVTVVATDTTAKSAKPKDQHNAALP